MPGDCQDASRQSHALETANPRHGRKRRCAESILLLAKDRFSMLPPGPKMAHKVQNEYSRRKLTATVRFS